MASGSDKHADGHGDELKAYLAVFAALMVLLIITVWVSFHHFGVFNPIIALTIAFTKTFLVILFFMHLRHARHLVWVVAGTGFFFLAILIGFVVADVLSRSWTDTSGRVVTEMPRLPGPFEELMREPEPASTATDTAPQG